MNQFFKTSKGTELPLLDLRGKPYLQVPHRIVWFREEKPDWVIEVTFSTIDANMAMARSEIRDTEGKLRAVAHKVEHQKHFQDYIEKAETGAIGRALAHLGYGTQFAPELEEGESNGEKRLADAPIQPAKRPESTQFKQSYTHHEPPPPYNEPVNYAPKGDKKLSEAQVKRLHAIMKSINSKGGSWSPVSLNKVLSEGYKIPDAYSLSKQEYDELCKAIEDGSTWEQIINAKNGKKSPIDNDPIPF